LPWYNCALSAINAAAPFLLPTQATNLALLVSAILKKQTLCLSELARAYPTSDQHRVATPKHDLLHRIKRLCGASPTTQGLMRLRPSWLSCPTSLPG
jgi:hypothetical protein